MITELRMIGMNEVRRWASQRSDTALVMGGGPSIEEDFAAVMEDGFDPVLISVKQHAMIYLASAQGIAADVCVFLEDPDHPRQVALRTALMMAPEVYRVSPFAAWSHIQIDEPWWNGGFSSALAVWFACAAGFERVLIAGMDCYQGARKYWYDRPGYSHPCLRSSVEDNLKAWRPALKHCPNAERIRAVSGPLVYVFGRWDT
jgi:uncharacterized Rossmann fold enzyme